MVHRDKLIVGKKYKLGDVMVGTFLRQDEDVVVFEHAELADEGEAEIENDSDDDYVEIKGSPKSIQRKPKALPSKASPKSPKASPSKASPKSPKASPSKASPKSPMSSLTESPMSSLTASPMSSLTASPMSSLTESPMSELLPTKKRSIKKSPRSPKKGGTKRHHKKRK